MRYADKLDMQLMPLSGVLKVATTTALFCRRGDDDVKLDGARLSRQGRYSPRVPHPSASSFSLPPFLPFLRVSARLPLSSILPSSPLTVYYYIGISLLCPPCPLPPLATPPPPPPPLPALTCLQPFISLLSSSSSPSPFLLLYKSFHLSSSSSLALFSSHCFSLLPPSLLSSRSCEPQCLARMNGSYLSCWQVHPVCVYVCMWVYVGVCVMLDRVRPWVLCVSTTWDVQIQAQCHFLRFSSSQIGKLL